VKQKQLLPNDLPLVDVHVHTGTLDSYSLPLSYLDHLCYQVQMRSCLCAPCSWEESLARLERTDPDPVPSAIIEKIRYWLWLSPVRQRAIEILNKEEPPSGYSGIKVHPFADHFDVTGPLLRPVFDAAERWRMPVAFHTGNIGCSPSAIARCLPSDFEQPVILFHSRPLDEALVAARSRPCILLESSFTDPDDFARCFDALGPERVLYGSDYPVGAVFLPGIDVVAQYRRNVEELLDVCERRGATRAFFSGNALRVFKDL